MMRFCKYLLPAGFVVAVLGCGRDSDKIAAGAEPGLGGAGSGGGTTAASSSSSSAPADDPDPVFTDADHAALNTLHYNPAAPPSDPSNRVADNPEARAFGQRLFFDPSFSGQLLDPDDDGNPATLGTIGEAGRVSCAGCHLPESGFIDTRSPHPQISLAAAWTVRRTPTLLEVASQPLYNWNARRDTLWNQAIGVIESSTEFNSGRLFFAEQIFRNHRENYEAIFGPITPELTAANGFPQLGPLDAGCSGEAATARCRGKPGDLADYDGMTPDAQVEVTTVIVNATKAIEAYLRELRCGASRFDRWLDGDDSALSRSEQRGAQLFVGRANCVGCHSSANLTDGKFHNVGLQPSVVAVAFVDQDDRGAAEGLALALQDPLNSKGAFSDGDRGVLPQTVGPEFEGAFQTPTLRCITNQRSFMHTGQFLKLETVVKFFDRGGDDIGYPGKSEILPLGLTDLERADLVAFLGVLQGAGPDASLLSRPSD